MGDHAARAAGTPYARLFWDLDGTLTDPREGIVRSAAAALARLGGSVDPALLDRFIGPPLARSFRTYGGLDADEAALAVRYYRERYEAVGWRENRLVPGIDALLADLGRAGVRMAVATVKPRPTAERILAMFGLLSYFERVHAPEVAEIGMDKGEVLGRAVGGRIWPGPGRAAMIGDHEDDMRAARHWGLAGIAVLYGYGDRQALMDASPVATAADVAALRALLTP